MLCFTQGKILCHCKVLGFLSDFILSEGILGSHRNYQFLSVEVDFTANTTEIPTGQMEIQIQIQMYTQIQVHKYKYTNASTQIQKYDDMGILPGG